MTAERCDADDYDGHGDAEDDTACWTCEDTGWYVPELSDITLPCASCERGDWNWMTEMSDDARRGK